MGTQTKHQYRQRGGKFNQKEEEEKEGGSKVRAWSQYCESYIHFEILRLWRKSAGERLLWAPPQLQTQLLVPQLVPTSLLPPDNLLVIYLFIYVLIIWSETWESYPRTQLLTSMSCRHQPARPVRWMNISCLFWLIGRFRSIWYIIPFHELSL